jgi:uncharacterized DUF497 family protein
MEFEWDASKAAVNRSKHGVSFDEASDVFGDAPIIDSDAFHSTYEDRFIATGVSTKNRILVVSHTYRDGRIRIISSRAATRKEQRDYGEAQT